ncbi:hypothetical protein MRX96_013852 [Rhipicephalus microplus]
MEEQRARRQLADPNEFPKLGKTAERAAAAATEQSPSRSMTAGTEAQVKEGARVTSAQIQVKRARRLDGRRQRKNQEEETVTAAEPRAERWRHRPRCQQPCRLYEGGDCGKQDHGDDSGTKRRVTERLKERKINERLDRMGEHNSATINAFNERFANFDRALRQVMAALQASGGQQVLRNLGLEPRRADEETAEEVEVPECVRRHVQMHPISKNVIPEYNGEWRAATARALIDLHTRDNGAVYEDAAEYKDRKGAFTAAVVSVVTGETKGVASVWARAAHRAERVAIALALADRGCTTVLSHSRTTMLAIPGNFHKSSNPTAYQGATRCFESLAHSPGYVLKVGWGLCISSC